MDAAQAQAFVDAIMAAAGVAANAAAATAANATAAANAAQPPAPFALLPGASNTAALDWNKTEAMKLFHKAIFALDPKFGMDEDNLRTFIEQVRERARIFNWNDLLTVNDSTGTARNILNSYGMVTLANCQAHAATHVGIAFSSRMAQDSMMLYQFLMNSLNDAAKLNILSDQESYTVNDQPSGVCFLKVIIGRSSIDTNAKIVMLRKKIARLADTMKNQFKGNVREFNTYVATQRDQLLGRGQVVSELLTHLFDAYLNGVNDEEFHRYIETYQNLYDDGTVVTPESLMKNALNKYDTIMQRKEVSGDNENRILALSAEKSETSKEMMEALVAKFQANYAPNNDSNKSGNKNFVKKIPAWKKEAPGESDHKKIVKTVNNKKKTFHWCTNHQMWTIHLPIRIVS
jgi:phage host-nuclease inhibitor protein Gam